MAKQKKEAVYLSRQDALQTREKKSVVVERELDRIYQKEGTVNQKLIVDLARDEKHPLHSYFEWDDEVAGEKYRLQQALTMIMASKFMVVLNKAPEGQVVAHAEPVRKLLPQFGGGGFKVRTEILEEDDARRLLVERKLGALRSWCRSVVDIRELAGIKAVIETALADEPATSKARQA